MIEKYNDDTFYAYMISYEWDNSKLLDLISKKSKNNKILLLIKYISNEQLIWKWKRFVDISDERKYWGKIDNEIDNKIKQIPEVNHNIF